MYQYIGFYIQEEIIPKFFLMTKDLIKNNMKSTERCFFIVKYYRLRIMIYMKYGGLTMKANKKEYKVVSPKIPDGLDEICLSDNSIKDEDSFSMSIVSDCIIDNQMAKQIRCRHMIFNKVTFVEVSFEGIDLTDVRFENCDLSNVDLSGAVIHRTEFVNCKILGINLSESSLQNVMFDNCVGGYASFMFSHLKQVSFKYCILNNADFQDSKFDKVAFCTSNLQEASMAGTKLGGIDFSDCEIEGLRVKIEDVYGVVVSPMQAVYFSKLLGLIVR